MSAGVSRLSFLIQKVGGIRPRGLESLPIRILVRLGARQKDIHLVDPIPDVAGSRLAAEWRRPS